jgi:putative membrane protein
MEMTIFILTMLVAVQHGLFMMLECVFWKEPLGKKIFRMDDAKAKATYPLAVNQGVYNGFLSAGLFCCLIWPENFGSTVQMFFLSCVVVAAIVGAFTVSIRILFVQGLLAAIALGLMIQSLAS